MVIALIALKKFLSNIFIIFNHLSGKNEIIAATAKHVINKGST